VGFAHFVIFVVHKKIEVPMFKSLRRKLFRRTLKVTHAPGKELHVLAVNPDAGVYAEALGISEERDIELQELVNMHIAKTKSSVVCMEKVSLEVVHANELMYCTVLAHNAVMPTIIPIHIDL